MPNEAVAHRRHGVGRAVELDQRVGLPAVDEQRQLADRPTHRHARRSAVGDDRGVAVGRARARCRRATCGSSASRRASGRRGDRRRARRRARGPTTAVGPAGRPRGGRRTRPCSRAGRRHRSATVRGAAVRTGCVRRAPTMATGRSAAGPSRCSWRAASPAPPAPRRDAARARRGGRQGRRSASPRTASARPVRARRRGRTACAARRTQASSREPRYRRSTSMSGAMSAWSASADRLRSLRGFTSLPPGVLIAFMRGRTLWGEPRGDVMRTVVSVVVASLIATSAVALSSVTDVGAVSPDVVISQVYGGGGNAGATLHQRLHRALQPRHRAGAARRLVGAVRQPRRERPGRRPRSPASCRRVRTTSSKRRQGAGGTTPLPTPDATGTIAMSGTSGKVALVTSTAALSCGSDCDTAAGVRDFVGYGTGANDFETAPTPTLSNTTAAIRAAVEPPTPTTTARTSPSGLRRRATAAHRAFRRHRRSRRCGSARSTTTTTGPTRARRSRSPVPPASTSPAGASCSTTSPVARSYDTIPLGGVLPDEGAGLGAAAFPDPPRASRTARTTASRSSNPSGPSSSS